MGCVPVLLAIAVNVARRGSKDVRPVRLVATASAADPLTRTTPIPPRPGGVATATIVSSVENMFFRGPRPAALPSRGNNHRLQIGVADTLGRHVRIFRNREVDEAARVWIQRAHLLRRAG